MDVVLYSIRTSVTGSARPTAPPALDCEDALVMALLAEASVKFLPATMRVLSLIVAALVMSW
ncbi:hypothetical protein [Mesorhizobium sp.]|uniref:hypothetical protein n=1 Tax=Mesorhizobium sp. TaxID=1871066 RepID=UPI0025B8CD29|nr:hypothetical protein [Mesorhizobium sp.]